MSLEFSLMSLGKKYRAKVLSRPDQTRARVTSVTQIPPKANKREAGSGDGDGACAATCIQSLLSLYLMCSLW